MQRGAFCDDAKKVMEAMYELGAKPHAIYLRLVALDLPYTIAQVQGWVKRTKAKELQVPRHMGNTWGGLQQVRVPRVWYLWYSWCAYFASDIVLDSTCFCLYVGVRLQRACYSSGCRSDVTYCVRTRIIFESSCRRDCGRHIYSTLACQPPTLQPECVWRFHRYRWHPWCVLERTDRRHSVHDGCTAACAANRVGIDHQRAHGHRAPDPPDRQGCCQEGNMLERLHCL
jgi:hypothetical protein